MVGRTEEGTVASSAMPHSASAAVIMQNAKKIISQVATHDVIVVNSNKFSCAATSIRNIPGGLRTFFGLLED